MAPRLCIGIIGGMGPEATVDLLRRIVARTAASDDADHVHLIVESDPAIPSRIAHLLEGTGPDPTASLVRIAQTLERAGARALAMPCNTAHCYLPAIRAAVTVPVLDMVSLAASEARRVSRAARVGLLASTAVRRTRLYDAALDPLGLSAVYPAEQDEVMDVIRAVKRGDAPTGCRERFARLADALAAEADLLLVACTELSLLAEDVAGRHPTVDASDVLADAVIAVAGAARRER